MSFQKWINNKGGNKMMRGELQDAISELIVAYNTFDDKTISHETINTIVDLLIESGQIRIDKVDVFGQISRVKVKTNRKDPMYLRFE